MVLGKMNSDARIAIGKMKVTTSLSVFELYCCLSLAFTPTWNEVWGIGWCFEWSLAAVSGRLLQQEEACLHLYLA